MSSKAEIQKKNVTLVLGGAQSGKSYYAQDLASRFQRVTFIATGRRTDAEMRKKIARHRKERPVRWRTIEAPLDLATAIVYGSQDAEIVVVDCLTVYVANVMAAHRKSKINAKEHIEAVCEAIRMAKASVVAVSNEVGSGVVPPYRSGRIYRDFLGQMNQRVAQLADNVVLMIAGLPVTLKDKGSNQRRSDASFTRLADRTFMTFADGHRNRQARSERE